MQEPLSRSTPSEEVRVAAATRMNEARIDAVSSAAEQTLVILQDDRARHRAINQG
jgi:hypothetical protein